MYKVTKITCWWSLCKIVIQCALSISRNVVLPCRLWVVYVISIIGYVSLKTTTMVKHILLLLLLANQCLIIACKAYTKKSHRHQTQLFPLTSLIIFTIEHVSLIRELTTSRVPDPCTAWRLENTHTINHSLLSDPSEQNCSSKVSGVTGLAHVDSWWRNVSELY